MTSLLVAALLSAGTARAQSLGAFVGPGPLAAPHADLEGLDRCTSCHAPGRGVTTDRCVACHDDVGAQVAAGKGFHADKADRCGTCHPDHRGRDFALARLDTGRIDHAKETGFPLRGRHQWLACEDCHTVGAWGGNRAECATCHESPHGEGHKTPLAACETCHTDASWEAPAISPAVFDHRDPADTTWVLEGRHASVGCRECHAEAVFVPTAAGACSTCHEDPHRAAFPSACESCHDVDGWRVPGFDHRRTGFVLDGRHATVGCRECHGASVIRPLRHGTCADCHADVHRGQFAPRPCDACHTTAVAGFRLPAFDHDATSFPLVGGHATVACDGCHGDGPRATWRPVVNDDCDACHTDPHVARFEPTPCRACHAETGWAVAAFDHGRTAFPLRGEHVPLPCEACHADGRWAGLPHGQCADCHADHPHAATPAAQTCDGCHDEAGWAAISFAHAARTAFDPAPQHAASDCTACHRVERFEGLDPGCVACHVEDEPAAHFDGDCAACHRGAGWVPADLGGADHALTGFPLAGAHTWLACDDCHGAAAAPRSLAARGCVGCHADDDVHRHMLGDVCEDCHAEVAWFRTRFRHQETGWSLRGAHRLAACVDCHAAGYAGTPDDCRWCHESEAPRAEPAHRSAFFPLCDECHRPFTWAAVPAR